MSNSTRWTLAGILIAVNVISNVILRDGWIAIAVSAVTGVAVIAVVIDYVLRRREQ